MSGALQMSLPQSLVSARLTFECPHCNLALTRTGAWFQVISNYECEGCRRKIRITYPDKIQIFKKHAHLA